MEVLYPQAGELAAISPQREIRCKFMRQWRKEDGGKISSFAKEVTRKHFPASQALSPILCSSFDALFGLQMYTHSKGSLLAQMSGSIRYSRSVLWRRHNSLVLI